jgi:hypothetical protein
MPALVSTALVSPLAVGTGLSILLRPGSVAAMVPAEGGCSIISGGGSTARAAVPGAGAWVPGAEAMMSPLGAACCHLAGEVFDTLQKCSAVREWGNARERRLGCGLGEAVHTAGRSIQVALGLAGENDPYVGGGG